MKIFLLKWFVSWGSLTDGIVGILTLGIYKPNLTLYAAKALARKRSGIK